MVEKYKDKEFEYHILCSGKVKTERKSRKNPNDLDNVLIIMFREAEQLAKNDDPHKVMKNPYFQNYFQRKFPYMKRHVA